MISLAGLPFDLPACGRQERTVCEVILCIRKASRFRWEASKSEGSIDIGVNIK